jgi:hypothetical protein
MTVSGSSRAFWNAEKSGQTSGTSEKRLAATRRRFIPRISELESRQLLSQLVVQNTADSGTGSLRSEMGLASPGDLITFAGSLRGQTITLASPIAINTSLTIRGFPGGALTVSGNGATQVFQIATGVSVNLNGMRIVSGSAARGGAIDNAGRLTVRSSVFTNNQAVGTASTAGMGGAVFNESGAALTLIQSQLLSNRAIDNVVSGGMAMGGAVASATGSRMIVRNSVFKFNQTISNQGPGGRAAGGAIAMTGATLSITGSRFVSNSAMGFLLGESGAIHNLDGVVTITNSVFNANQGIGTGAGGYAASGAVTNKSDSSGSATMTVRNSTFTRNQAIAMGTGGDGVTTLSAAFGGAMGTSGLSVVVNVSSSRFAANQAIAAMPSSTSTGNLLAGVAVGGAIENDSGAIFNLRNSVVTGNVARGGASGGSGSGGAAFGGGIGSFMGGAILNVTNTAVAGNLAQGGGGTFGDGWGGGVADFQDARASLSGVTVAGNRAVGGAGASGAPGSGAGGGGLLVGLGFSSSTPGFVFPDASSAAISNSTITGNLALGGSGSTAGDASGGGIDLGGGMVTMRSTFVGGNTARGGTGATGGQSGNGSGGGSFIDVGTTFNVQTSSIIGNLAAGGSTFMGSLSGAGVGGGLYIQTGGLVFLNGSTLVIANRATTASNQIFGVVQG